MTSSISMMQVSPYVFPGIYGTMLQPYPSDYPSVMQVLFAVCHVYERYGRRCGAYASASDKALPPITPDMILRFQGNSTLVHDVRRMLIVIVRDGIRWKSKPSSVPKRYTINHIAKSLRMRPSTGRAAYRRAKGLLDVDTCFISCHHMIIECLRSEFRVDV